MFCDRPVSGSQGLEQTAGTEQAREGVIALSTVELETEFAGQVNPNRHLLLFSWRGIGFRQALDDLSPDEVAEQIRFGSFRDVLQVIEVAVAQSVQHERAVVLKSERGPLFSPPTGSRWGGGRRRVFSKRSMWTSIRLMQFDQGGAGVAEAAIVFGPLAEARAFAGRQSAQAGLTLLGPGKHGGSMQGPLGGGAVTRGLAAAGLEVVDRTFDELTEGEQDHRSDGW